MTGGLKIRLPIFQRLPRLGALGKTVIRRGAQLVFFFAFLLSFAFENAGDLMKEVGPQTAYRQFFEAGYWYQNVVGSGPRKARAHRVSLVTFTTKRDTLMGLSGCRLRLFFAQLLRRLSSVGPAVIVIDGNFSEQGCLSDESISFRNAVEHLTKDLRIPVILGLPTDSQSDVDRELDGKASVEVKLPSNTLVIRAGTLFNPAIDRRISLGAIRLNYDVRKIPLKWAVYNSLEEVKTTDPQVLPSLSLAAVQVVDPESVQMPRLQQMIKRNVHPFTSFLRENQFRQVSALQLICNDPTAREWVKCGGDEGDRNSLELFRARVVVIGERDTGRDFHQSPVGDVPGYVLHANYIESLLDDRYLHPVNFWMQLFLSVIWFSMLEIIFRLQATPERGLIYALAATTMLAFMFYYLVILTLGYYLVLWPPTILGILTRYVQVRLG